MNRAERKAISREEVITKFELLTLWNKLEDAVHFSDRLSEKEMYDIQINFLCPNCIVADCDQLPKWIEARDLDIKEGKI